MGGALLIDIDHSALTKYVVLHLKTAALALMLGQGRGLYLLAVLTLSRLAMVYQAAFNVYARRQVSKVSMANHFIDRACSRHFVIALAHAAAVLALAVILGCAWMKVLQLALLAWLVSASLGHLSRKQVGGVTGDILGATCEIVECALLVAAAL